MIEKLKNRKPIFHIKLAVVAVLVCAVLTGCDNSLWRKSKFHSDHGGSPYFDAKCLNFPYKTDKANLNLYLGFYNIEESFVSSPNKQSLWVIYICRDNEDLYAKHVPNEVVDYKAIENYYYITEITHTEAYTAFGFKENFFGNLKYEKSITINIPNEILKEFDGSFLIRPVSVTKNDGGTYSWQGHHFIRTVRVEYEFTDDEHVKLNTDVRQRKD